MALDKNPIDITKLICENIKRSFERRHEERYRKVFRREMTLAEAIAEHDKDWHDTKTLSGDSLESGEKWPCDPPQEGCRLCNWPYDDGYGCSRAGGVVRQPLLDE